MGTHFRRSYSLGDKQMYARVSERAWRQGSRREKWSVTVVLHLSGTSVHLIKSHSLGRFDKGTDRLRSRAIKTRIMTTELAEFGLIMLGTRPLFDVDELSLGTSKRCFVFETCVSRRRQCSGNRPQYVLPSFFVRSEDPALGVTYHEHDESVVACRFRVITKRYIPESH